MARADGIVAGAASEPPATADPWADRQAVARHTYAALDLGTNNCRLLVARPARQGFRVVEAFSRIVRLGEGLQATGRLSDGAMQRTLEALRICAERMRRRGVDRARCVATEACRQAANGAEFLACVEAETGLRFDVISSAEEARLAVAGCAPLIDPLADHVLVFDIGGGSTELTWLSGAGEAEPAWLSIPCGVVSLCEQYGGQTISAATYRAMVDGVEHRLRPFAERWRPDGERELGRLQMLGTSGTVTTLVGIRLGLPRYDRRRVDGQWLEVRQALGIVRRLRAMTFAERAAEPCIGCERADLVVAGCAVFEAICRTWPVPRLRVADRGVREGVLQDLMRDSANGHWPA